MIESGLALAYFRRLSRHGGVVSDLSCAYHLHTYSLRPSLTNNQRVNLTSVFDYRHTELSHKPLLQIPMTTKANTTRPRLARKV